MSFQRRRVNYVVGISFSDLFYIALVRWKHATWQRAPCKWDFTGELISLSDARCHLPAANPTMLNPELGLC